MVAGGYVATTNSAYEHDESRWSGVARIVGPTWAQMPLSTIGMVGLQIVWSVEMSNAPAYLLTLGMSRAAMSVVLLAGPLSGLIVQPLVGALADANTSRFGRRRPYILGGALICAFAMLLLGFTRAVATIVTSAGSKANDALTVFLAALAVFCIDFSVNAVQAADRAILVDVWPREEQERGNAWAARMGGIGSITGFFIGNVDLTRVASFFGDTQIKILSAVSAVTLVGFHAATCWAVKERVQLIAPDDGNPSHTGKRRAPNPIRTLWRDVQALPKTIRDICLIQFFVWIAWFPVLFYTSVYVGDIYKRTVQPPDWTAQMIEDEATREGSRALFYNALVAFGGTLVLPFCILAERERTREEALQGRGRGWISTGGSRLRKPTLAELWTASHGLFALCMAATWWISTVRGAQTMMAVLGLCSAMGAWAPFSLLGQAILSDSDSGVANGNDEGDIALRDRRTQAGTYESLPPADAEERERLNDETHVANGSGVHSRNSFDSTQSDAEEEDDDPTPRPRASLGSNAAALVSHASIELASPRPLLGDDEEGEGEGHVYERKRKQGGGIGDKGGSILGIHNVFVVIPQFVASGLSSLIFAVFEPERTTPHPSVADVPPPAGAGAGAIPADATDNPFLDGRALSWMGRRADAEVQQAGSDAMGIIFRIGGVSSLVACALCWRLAKDLRRRS
ncbi:MFS general substrate transporter [Auriculariales sp. MPI-PUGE-AT-0066]|nr:MFS general substrate transporter [Auriculariales sp. MPI-PUGE-AT-0066]